MQLARTTEELEVAFGSSIQRLRHTHGLSQRELADRANVSLSALKNLEHGRGSSLTTVVQIVRALERREWLDAPAPVEPTFSPMEAMRRASAAGQPRRARPSRSGS